MGKVLKFPPPGSDVLHALNHVHQPMLHVDNPILPKSPCLQLHQQSPQSASQPLTLGVRPVPSLPHPVLPSSPLDSPNGGPRALPPILAPHIKWLCMS